MKTIVAFLLVAACIATCYSIPSVSKTPQWTQHATKIKDFTNLALPKTDILGDINPKANWLYVTFLFIAVRFKVDSLYTDIEKVIKNVDVSLRDSIYDKIDASVNQTYPILNEGAEHITWYRLSRKHTIDLFDNQLIDGIEQFSKDLQPELDQLPDALASIIRNIITIAKIDIPEKTEYVRFYLDFARRDVASGAEAIHNYALANLEEIRAIAVNDNEAIGARIGKELDDMAEEFIADYGNYTTRISQGAIIVTDADWYKGRVVNNYLIIPSGILDDLLRLNVTAAAEIVELTKVGVKGLEKKGDELIRLIKNGEL